VKFFHPCRIEGLHDERASFRADHGTSRGSVAVAFAGSSERHEKQTKETTIQTARASAI